MIEVDGNPSRPPPLEPPPRPETPEQRRAQEFWNRVIETVPIVATGIGRGPATEVQPSRTVDARGAAARQAARPDGQATPVTAGASASDPFARTPEGDVWRTLIESQPPQRGAAAAQTRSQGRTPGS